MKTAIVKEDPAFVLSHEDYNENYELKVSWPDLRNAKVGDVFEPQNSNCGRGVRHESAKIVFKDEDGVAVLFKEEASTDEPNPEWLDDQIKLVWYQF